MVSRNSNNRQVIDEALNVFAIGLRPFVAERTNLEIDEDPSALIRLMLDRWEDAFHEVLGYRGKNLLYEIRDILNDWAHNSRHFDDDETDRALDSIERLLSAIDATDEAARLRRVKEDRRRARYVETVDAIPAAGIRSRSSHRQDPLQAEWEGFARYLKDVRDMSERSVRSRVSNCKRVAQFEGDLNHHFETDECRNLLDRLRYTTRDQNLRRKPNHGIPIDGDVRTGSATLKQAVSLYVRFRQDVTPSTLPTEG